jgi:hypothetical protein
MKLLKITLILFMLVGSGSVLADCPNSLPANKLIDCIVMEGAGDVYDSETDEKQPQSTNHEESKKQDSPKKQDVGKQADDNIVGMHV